MDSYGGFDSIDPRLFRKSNETNCQFAINCRGNTEITVTKEGEVVDLRLTNTGFEPRKWVFTNQHNTTGKTHKKCMTLQNAGKATRYGRK